GRRIQVRQTFRAGQAISLEFVGNAVAPAGRDLVDRQALAPGSGAEHRIRRHWHVSTVTTTVAGVLRVRSAHSTPPSTRHPFWSAPRLAGIDALPGRRRL